MTQKKPAARDISDLKARLGLKKQGGGASASTGGVPAPGGIAPPPGASVPAPAGLRPPPGAAVPAPPGVQPPPGMRQPAPQIPDATKDPFGAMNAMAAHSQHVRQPEIVVVNDGGPVESVEAKSAGLKFGKIAAFLLGPLIVGVAIGQISSSAKRSNEVIEDAAKIRDDLKRVNRGLVDLNDILLEAKTRGAGGKMFKINDQQLTKELAAFEFPELKAGIVYESSMYELPVEVVENLLYYYSEMAKLKESLGEHTTKAEQDFKAIDEAGKRLSEQLRGGFRLGATIQMPSDDEAKAGFPPKVRIVELGAPVCQNGKPGQCEGAPKGFTIREDAKNLSWSNKSFTSTTGDAVSSSGVMLVQPTPVLTDAIAGADASLAQTFYMKRILAIDEKVQQLTDIGNKLAAQLNGKANESKKFTFFM